MKQLVKADNYEFLASLQKVLFINLDPLILSQILLITNVTKNEIIYSFSVKGQGGVVLDNALALDFDTTLMSSGDELQIFIDVDEPLPVIEQTPTGEIVDNKLYNEQQTNLLSSILEEIKLSNELLKSILS